MRGLTSAVILFAPKIAFFGWDAVTRSGTAFDGNPTRDFTEARTANGATRQNTRYSDAQRTHSR